jgi:hypothetical protein
MIKTTVGDQYYKIEPKNELERAQIEGRLVPVSCKEAIQETSFEKGEIISREHNVLLRNTGELKRRRIMIGIPMTGLLRAEWVLARYGQVIPCNWAHVDSLHWIDQYSPIDFMVADARNCIVHNFIQKGFEWLFQIDQDVVLPYDCFLRVNEYILKRDIPMLSGLYFTKSRPSEPLIYRGRGTSYYTNWKLGDKVWVDGIPSGITLIHRSILEVLYNESDSYEVMPGLTVKEVYRTPAKVWYDAEDRSWYAATGTEDLTLCSRIMEEKVFEKAGWPEFQKKEFPFLCDTGIFGRHIDNDGVSYPCHGEESQFK